MVSPTNAKNVERRFRLCLLGDVSLNGRWSTDEECRLFVPEVQEMIAGHDAVLLNLESPIRGDGRENLLKNPRLSTCAKAIEKLECLRPRVCVLGNNHVYDHLELGFKRTLEAVKSLGAIPVGAGLTLLEAREPARFELNGSSVSVLAYTGAETNPNLRDDAGVFLNMIEPDRMLQEVQRESESGRFIVVSLHWGEEYYRFPAPWQRRLATSLVDAGADVIWGHHAHVCQGWERVRDSYVLYCLGNSVFDDVEGAPKWSKLGKESLCVSVSDCSGPSRARDLDVRLVRRITAVDPGEFAATEELERVLCQAFRWPAFVYGVFYGLVRAQSLLKRVRYFFFGDGRNPWEQIVRLPSRVWKALVR